MNKHDFRNLAISMSILSFMITSVACVNKSKDSGKNISSEAAKIAPLFKSAKYQDGKGNILPYRYFEPSLVIQLVMLSDIKR